MGTVCGTDRVRGAIAADALFGSRCRMPGTRAPRSSRPLLPDASSHLGLGHATRAASFLPERKADPALAKTRGNIKAFSDLSNS